jgi:tetratricopeptide (TPR) repeat protein
VLVGPGCHEATADIAEFESLGLRDLKGLGEVPAWRFVRLTGVRVPAVPFFGRREELERLRSSFARARMGRAALAVVIGPPGQGKTRLAEELIRDVDGQARLLQARCRPGGEIGSLTPLKQILASDVVDPTPEAMGARVEVLLDDPSERRRVTAALCHSAGLLVDERLLSLRPFEREQELAFAWHRYFDGLGREQTVLLWIEDVHWAEPQLVRLMDRVTFSGDLPLLVLATGRPEFGAAAVLRPGEGRLILELGRLDLDASLALARALGSTDDQAIRRAEGHPLFIIELARSRLPSGQELPLNVQAAIAARLDELPSTERELLQCAAVAGETFTVHDAALLGSRDPAEVAGILGRLVHLQYLHPLTQGFRFHHVLVHDVAYGRLPAAERMRLHARHAWEGVDPDDAEALAHHWWEALRPPDADWVWEGAAEREEMRKEALKAHLAAGRRLSDRLERERAVEVLERVLALAHGPREVASVEEAIAFAHTRDGRGDEAWEHHLRAIAAYREAGTDPPASLYAEMLETPVHRWGFFRVLPHEDLVLRLLLEGQQIARATQDIPSLARLLAHHAYFHLQHEVAGEAVRLVETWQDPPQLADVLQRAAALFLQTGEIDRAKAAYERMDRLMATGGHIEELDALMWRAILAFAAGNLVRAGEFADRLLERSATSNAHWRTHALGTMGLVLLGRGEWSAVEDIAATTDGIVTSHPGVGFCLIGAAAIAYGASASVLAGRPLPDQLAAFMERCTPESAAVRASILLVPYAMAGLADIDPLSLEAWRPGQRSWDRQVWDPFGLTLVIALTMLERWDLLEPPLRRLEEVSGKGGRACGALAAAAREEMAAARGGPSPTHAELRGLGYVGLSELISYRPRTKTPAANLVRTDI